MRKTIFSILGVVGMLFAPMSVVSLATSAAAQNNTTTTGTTKTCATGLVGTYPNCKISVAKPTKTCPTGQTLVPATTTGGKTTPAKCVRNTTPVSKTCPTGEHLTTATATAPAKCVKNTVTPPAKTCPTGQTLTAGKCVRNPVAKTCRVNSKAAKVTDSNGVSHYTSLTTTTPSTSTKPPLTCPTTKGTTCAN